jgi:hypothetical protein
MAVPSTGPLRTGPIRTEYGGTTPMRLGNYRRGNAAGWVKANAAGNIAVNHSAAVGTAVLRMSQFRGQYKGWTYTNATVRTNSFSIGSVFGTDWTVAWPKTFINNAAMGATSTSYYACVIDGGTGGFSFVNNSEIQGAGGATTSAVGQHALRIQNTAAGANRPIITNNAAIRGGGGAGGKGGTGGTGGGGVYYTTSATEGPVWQSSPPIYQFNSHPSSGRIDWNGAALVTGINGTVASYYIAPYTYYRGSLGPGQTYSCYVSRNQQITNNTNGGAGGAGGNGGRGIGYGAANAAGVAGAAGAAGGTNAGAGGKGGTGGTGQTWGTTGNTGATGATGATGNRTGGVAGAAGAAGGAGGDAISAASPWGLAVTGTLSGSWSGTAPT